MRVSFLGKGGSGKTTIASSFINYLNGINLPVLAVDADINVNLGKSLGMDTKYIGNSFKDITSYLEPEKVNLKNPIIGTTPVTYKSKFIRPNIGDEFFKKFATFKDNMALLTVGTYEDGKIGCDCYHSKLGNAVLVYNRLLDNKNFYVVTDSTAGIDSVGTSMFYVSDINIFVVEPTIKSIDVFKDFERLTKKYDVKNYVIANKIYNDEDINFIKSQIDPNVIIGFVHYSEHLKKYEQGNNLELQNFNSDNIELNKKIKSLLDSTNKDWDKYYDTQKQIYINDAGDWYSQYFGEDLTKYIDQDFNYNKVLD